MKLLKTRELPRHVSCSVDVGVDHWQYPTTHLASLSTLVFVLLINTFYLTLPWKNDSQGHSCACIMEDNSANALGLRFHRRKH
ncbi:hypothetical protein BDV41DRAFT_547519 [Aspergillus transmontanensis]|uniref:Uncharacterized protein n=1 Tax=Aspergillus transmontanensis TaxID=1034304 RepID=A0A5N6VM55_9EURO|nr:hypothetical protein BDV41DRAFT_547519 [Aspergillus transmontanensis]